MTDTTTQISFGTAFEFEPEEGTASLVVIYGADLGRKYDLSFGMHTIGRVEGVGIVVPVESVSRRHACIEVGREHAWAVDLGSTNGTYVNDIPITRQMLSSGDLVRVGDVIFKFLAGHHVEAAYHEEIYRLAIRDGLTSIANNRYLHEFLERECARARRHGRKLSVIMLDIDHFKQINDRHGHLTGDDVLRGLAQLLATRVRRDELVARYGGEEFCLILPETGVDGALAYAEILRDLVERHTFESDGNLLKLTISAGVASFSSDMHSPMDLLRAADEALYRAKSGGRNRVSP